MNVSKNASEILEMGNSIIEIEATSINIELAIVGGSEMGGRTLQVTWDSALKG